MQQSAEQIKCVPFKDGALLETVRSHLELNSNWSAPAQVQYLSSYLIDAEIATRTMVVESHYIDRHFMEEHGAYYSRCLRAPNNYCTRLHFFADQFDDGHLNKLFEVEDDTSQLLKDFSSSYLGFVVLRPLRETPIGRTILKSFPPKAKKGFRLFGPQVRRSVHLGSIKLFVTGLPFQQQDQRVGACATTAIWCSLARMADSDGGRAPTPSQITEAAVRYNLPGGRAYPSAGLGLQQMCEALRSLSASPELIVLGGKATAGKLLMRAYLRSHMAPILALRPCKLVKIGTETVFVPTSGENHAVTLAGYRDQNAVTHDGAVRPSSNFERIYIHDDRSGPYARAGILSAKSQFRENGPITEEIIVTIHSETWFASHMIVPLYAKLRASMAEFFEIAAFYKHGMALLFTAAQNAVPIGKQDIKKVPINDFEIDVRIIKGGEYLSELRCGKRVKTSAGMLSSLSRCAKFSRYVGVLEVYRKGQLVADLIWDTTDRVRFRPPDSLLACVCFDDSARASFENYFKPLDVIIA